MKGAAMDGGTLDDLEVFVSELVDGQLFRVMSYVTSERSLFCPRCGGLRRMTITSRYAPDPTNHALNTLATRNPGGAPPAPPSNKIPSQPPPAAPLSSVLRIATHIVPLLTSLECVQCSATFEALIYKSSEGPALAILPSIPGGLRTPHTPTSVAYYLDQAQRAHSVGANSAAVAMYRAALEQLLLEAGFQERMLGPKIKALEDAIAAKSAPKWALDLQIDFLQVLKELGNAAIHAGDVQRQAHLDSHLLQQVQITFMHLLNLVYEVEHEAQSRLKSLRASAEAMQK